MIGTDKVEPRTPVEAPALPARPAGRGGERRPRGQARGATRRVVREPVAPDAEESGETPTSPPPGRIDIIA